MIHTLSRYSNTKQFVSKMKMKNTGNQKLLRFILYSLPIQMLAPSLLNHLRLKIGYSSGWKQVTRGEFDYNCRATVLRW